VHVHPSAIDPSISSLEKEGRGCNHKSKDAGAPTEEQQQQQPQPPLGQQWPLPPVEGLKSSSYVVPDVAGRPRLETEQFSLLDPDDDCEESSGGSMCSAEQAAAECASGEVPPRLSYMFEHNDLINNRIAALASAIRTGVLTPRRVRWSVSAADVASTGGTCSSNNSSCSSRASPRHDARELAHAGLEDSVQATGAEAEQEKSLEGRCRVLEQMLQEAQRENASLREQLARASLTSADKATRKNSEGVQLHRLPCERKLSVSAPELDPPPALAVGPLAEPFQEGATTAEVLPPGGARRSTQRRQTRRRLVQEQARLRNSIVSPAGLPRLSVPHDEKLEECETIITRLVDEIEVLTTGKVAAKKPEMSVPEQDTVTLPGSPGVSAKDERPSPRPSAFFAVEDLKNAISDFFGGFGPAEAEPVPSSKKLQTAQRMQLAAKKMQAHKPRRTRIRDEGRRSVQQPSKSEAFL